MYCCSYVDHSPGPCPCPDHDRSNLHPFGALDSVPGICARCSETLADTGTPCPDCITLWS